MKYFLLSIITIFSLSAMNSYSQQSEQVSSELDLAFLSQDNNTLTTNSNGIIIDDYKYVKLGKFVEQDTSTVKNEITTIYSSDQINFKVRISLKEYNVPIKLTVFNMLGNLVKEIYNGTAVKGTEYPLDATNLPNGLYLCILEGRNFRDAEKFIISR